MPVLPLVGSMMIVSCWIFPARRRVDQGWPMRALASVSRRCGNGVLHVTTPQARSRPQVVTGVW